MTTLLLFGATGDLAQRMLLPSLFGLDSDGLLPTDLRIIGTARSDLNDAGYRALARKALADHVVADRLREELVERFVARLSYVTVDASKPEQFGALRDAVGPGETSLSIFLSTAPSLFGSTIAGLAEVGLAHGNVRLALEKPLGHDLVSSRAINDAVAAAFPETRKTRIYPP